MNFQGIEICSPCCRAELEYAGSSRETLVCSTCRHRFPVQLGIPDLRLAPDPYIEPEADRAKGTKVAARMQELSFSELIDYYYSVTSVVPPQHARQYKRGLMAGVPRAEATLASWDQVAPANGHSGPLLDLGCGTAPLLVAAARRFPKLAGVDIAFRWLVVGKKRLEEAGIKVPLICACAEALPFPDQTFERVVFESTLEVVADQKKALAESNRVMCRGGHVLITTPNRHSLGPDPHLGVWAGGLWPESWLAAHARRQGAVPPHRTLLSAKTLKNLVSAAGFDSPRISLPQISAAQRAQLRKEVQWLINLYQTGQRLPLTRGLLLRIGPLLQAVASKHP